MSLNRQLPQYLLAALDLTHSRSNIAMPFVALSVFFDRLRLMRSVSEFRSAMDGESSMFGSGAKRAWAGESRFFDPCRVSVQGLAR
jgi:hypothetical protein